MAKKNELVKKEQITIEDYEKKYVKHENVKNAKAIIFLILSVIGAFFVTCLLILILKAFEINQYFGYGAIGLAVILLVFFFIVPIVKVFKSEYFIVNVNKQTAREAKKHNKATRKKIAEKIIDFSDKVNTVKWYDEETVGKLAVAVTTNNSDAIKENLTSLYKGSVKKTCRGIITKAAIKSGTLSAISQNGFLDVALVTTSNMKMIKDIIFLYGFRPSDAKLSKIYTSVLGAALSAYGISSVNVGGKLIDKWLPNLDFISSIADSVIQGVTNAILTALIGRQTLKYLEKEYNLQNILE